MSATKKRPGLWANINKRKKAGTSRSKKKSTISKEAYKKMQAGFKKKKAKKIVKYSINCSIKDRVWEGEKSISYRVVTRQNSPKIVLMPELKTAIAICNSYIPRIVKV